jgi:RNA polymerase sigma-70 factor, ECF subfamily
MRICPNKQYFVQIDCKVSEYTKKFIILYDKYHEGIYRFLRIKLPSTELAQDLTSETFLRTWEYLSKNPTKYPDNPRAYVYRTAHNCLVDYFRNRKPEFSMDESTMEFIDKSRENDTMYADVHTDIVQMDRVYRAVQGLPDDYTELVVLKYVEEMSNREIAEILEKSEGAVRTALSRAMAKLRGQLPDST